MKSNNRIRSGIGRIALSLAALCCGVCLQPVAAAQPDLVLLVVVDQVRGDMPERLRERFGPEGFRRLMDGGTRYGSARYQHANTVTCAGHATLATGGNAPQHGIAANDWFDTGTQRMVNCVEDDRYTETGLPPGSGSGHSPHYLTSSTFGDELVLASGGRSRVFAVSIKDRGAIMLGGKFGKAYWYSKSTGGFVSSTYYLEQYPQWVGRWNDDRQADRYSGTSWALLHEQSTYSAGERDDRAYERPPGGLGRTFPHSLPQADRQALYADLPFTPMGDELTLAFVEALVAAEQPGRRGSTDVLAVSFSASDYIGHAFGPNSLEAEDNLLRLDRTLARLFRLIDRSVGLDRTLIVLSSDHGMAPEPEYLAELGIEAGRLGATRLMDRVNAAVAARFATGERLAPLFRGSGVYLDLEVLAKLGLDVAAVEGAVADELSRLPGLAFALTRTDLLAGNIPRTPEARRVAAAFHPRRSGNVFLVQEAFWYLDLEPDGNAATHGSPYAYDTLVPLMFAGPGIAQRVIYRAVAPRDLAPTISACLGIPPPSGSVGVPLREVTKSSP